MRHGDFVQTYSGIEFYPLDPKKEEINIIDIAHSLSNLCRFTGHCKNFYSVAQHCVLVSQNVSKENALWGLLHDSSETYINDLARPLKHSPEMTIYREVENNILKIIAEKFNLSFPEPEAIKNVDKVLLVTEARDLGLLTKKWQHYYLKPFDWNIVTLHPAEAKKLFLDRFYELTK